MAYLEEMLMRQAAAAREQQAAQALLRRLQTVEWAAAEQKRKETPLPEVTEQMSVETDTADMALTEREATVMSDRMQERERVSMVGDADTDVVQHSNAPIQRLLRQLAALAGETAPYAGPETMGAEVQTAESANWMRMAVRLDRAVRGAQTMPQEVQRGERLASDGPRSMEPYGQADAAALSRLYERDARRYDSRFELPL